MAKKIKFYQVDAFTDKLFAGNPAGVCMLDFWIDDDLMQSIATENNMAETAFVVPADGGFEIRWFTPAVEVDLCGHATLATGYVLYEIFNYSGTVINFNSPRSGLLKVYKKQDVFYLDFPTDTITLLDKDAVETIHKAIGVKPVDVFKGKTDYIAEIEDENTLANLKPDLNAIANLKARGLIVTAKGDDVDFVSRFFAPQSGINEDPVTGSAHTSLLPIWANKLGKTDFKAKQLSKRGGELICTFKDDRCMIGGKAVLYMVGEITIG